MDSGISTVFLSSDPDELCDRLKLLIPEKQAGKIFNIINDETVAIVDNSLKYKCMYKKQHKQLLIKCYLLQKLFLYNYIFSNINIFLNVQILFLTSIKN